MGSNLVLTVSSQGADVYSVMTRIAIASIRSSGNDARICLALDETSAAALSACRDSLLAEADEVLVCETPEGSSAFKNRFVKTSLRNRITGPFLSMDSDVLVRASLMELFRADADVAAARNHSTVDLSTQIWEGDRRILGRMEWAPRPDAYVNGGLLFLNDTLGARRFAKRWHENWLRSHEVTGSHRDQPALNHSLAETGASLLLLEDSWNAQVAVSPKTAIGAKLWHFYSADHLENPTAFSLLVGRVLAGAALDAEEVQRLIRAPHPWSRSGIIGHLAVSRIVSRNRFDGWESAAMKGQLYRHARRSVVARVRAAQSRVRAFASRLLD